MADHLKITGYLSEQQTSDALNPEERKTFSERDLLEHDPYSILALTGCQPSEDELSATAPFSIPELALEESDHNHSTNEDRLAKERAARFQEALGELKEKNTDSEKQLQAAHDIVNSPILHGAKETREILDLLEQEHLSESIQVALAVGVLLSGDRVDVDSEQYITLARKAYDLATRTPPSEEYPNQLKDARFYLLRLGTFEDALHVVRTDFENDPTSIEDALRTTAFRHHLPSQKEKLFEAIYELSNGESKVSPIQLLESLEMVDHELFGEFLLSILDTSKGTPDNDSVRTLIVEYWDRASISGVLSPEYFNTALVEERDSFVASIVKSIQAGSIPPGAGRFASRCRSPEVGGAVFDFWNQHGDSLPPLERARALSELVQSERFRTHGFPLLTQVKLLVQEGIGESEEFQSLTQALFDSANLKQCSEISQFLIAEENENVRDAFVQAALNSNSPSAREACAQYVEVMLTEFQASGELPTQLALEVANHVMANEIDEGNSLEKAIQLFTLAGAHPEVERASLHLVVEGLVEAAPISPLAAIGLTNLMSDLHNQAVKRDILSVHYLLERLDLSEFAEAIMHGSLHAPTPKERDSLLAYGAALEKCEELGIEKPFRFSPELFQQLVQNRLSVEDTLREGEKLAVVTFGRADHNGAIYTTNQEILALQENGYRVLYYEVTRDLTIGEDLASAKENEEPISALDSLFTQRDHPTDSIVEAIFDAGLKGHPTEDERKIDLLLVGGHGSREGIALGAGDPRLVDEGNSEAVLHLEDAEHLKQCGITAFFDSERTRIATMSCSVGGEGLEDASSDNILMTLREAFGDTIRKDGIFGAKYPVDSLEWQLIFDKDGDLIDIRYGVPKLFVDNYKPSEAQRVRSDFKAA
ncbi:hypothetical protein MRY87_09600 [bacterium]|nr:hypothetical protein [bacterium]